MKLAIVESPGKIKTIQKYLGADWIVKASIGHIRDLPSDALGVSPPDFKPHYVITPDKKKVVADLKAAAAKADEVFLATDDDREGEAIAFHLKVVLGLNNPKRVRFNEITPNSIKAAFSKPGVIDQNKVSAQEARRVLDRLVGYTVSGRLCKLAQATLSAGRVQSPAVKLLYLREQERVQFRKRNYYEVYADIGSGISALLDVEHWSEDGKHLFDQELAKQIATITSITIESVVSEEKETNPRPPLTTSTLQQMASSIFGFSPEKTMELAQTLYEQGLITYHRTDNPNLSEEAFAGLSDYLVENGIANQQTQIKFKSKDGAQEAHEAIRPAHWDVVQAGGNEKEQQLYSLIRERALCSAMPPAVDSTKTITFISPKEFPYGSINQFPKFVLSGRVEKYSGWRSYAKIEPSNTKFLAINREFTKGDSLSIKCRIESKTTEPPPRYTEASLVKALEKLGIGRPSTYASIMSNIKKRGYYTLAKGKGKSEKSIEPSDLGCAIVESLDKMTFMNLDFTRIVESQLDKIAAGKAGYLSLVSSVNATIEKELVTISIPVMATLAICPACNNQLKRLESTKRKSEFFWVHINDEHGCHDFVSDQDGAPVVKERKVRPQQNCPGCGHAIQRIEKDGSAFWAHIDDKHSKGCARFIKDVAGEPCIVKDETVSCPKCKNTLIRKFSQAKSFHFWVHQDEKTGAKCQKFINDHEGAPVCD